MTPFEEATQYERLPDNRLSQADRQTLVLSCWKLAYKLSNDRLKKMRKHNLPLRFDGFTTRDELFSRALVGLEIASRKFDANTPNKRYPGEPIKFSTYATWRIRGAIARVEDLLLGHEMGSSQAMLDTRQGMDEIAADHVGEEWVEETGVNWGHVHAVVGSDRDVTMLIQHYGHGHHTRQLSDAHGVTRQCAHQAVVRAVAKLRLEGEAKCTQFGRLVTRPTRRHADLRVPTHKYRKEAVRG